MPGAPTRVVIAEDEHLLAEALQTSLLATWPELEVVACVHDGGSALQAIYQHVPDVVFLDIRMPVMSGLEVAHTLIDEWPAHPQDELYGKFERRSNGTTSTRRLDVGARSSVAPPASTVPAPKEGIAMPPAPPLIVFVTAYDDHAIEAFDLAAIDYLLKPVDERRLKTTIQRLQERLDLHSQSSAPLEDLVQQLSPLLSGLKSHTATEEPLTHIRASVGNQVTVVPARDVMYLQSTDKYVTVASVSGELLLRSSLSSLEPRLGEQFVRIHRSCIVNLDYVSHIVRDEFGRTRLHLRDRAETLPVSRVYAHYFRPM